MHAFRFARGLPNSRQLLNTDRPGQIERCSVGMALKNMVQQRITARGLSVQGEYGNRSVIQNRPGFAFRKEPYLDSITFCLGSHDEEFGKSTEPYGELPIRHIRGGQTTFTSIAQYDIIIAV